MASGKSSLKYPNKLNAGVVLPLCFNLGENDETFYLLPKFLFANSKFIFEITGPKLARRGVQNINIMAQNRELFFQRSPTDAPPYKARWGTLGSTRTESLLKDPPRKSEFQTLKFR